MVIKGDVLNAFVEERELKEKDGTTRKAKISHVALSLPNPSGGVEIINLRSYDADWKLPKIGDKGWETPRVKRYECFDGMVADVSV